MIAFDRRIHHFERMQKTGTAGATGSRTAESRGSCAARSRGASRDQARARASDRCQQAGRACARLH